jgi:mannan endo-1,4-beta-mannosidase
MQRKLLTLLGFLSSLFPLAAQAPEPLPRPPADSLATAPARQLLALLYELSGKKILSGQHNQPIHLSQWTEKVLELTGQYPAVWGQDFGFSAPNTLDGINFRQPIIEEAIRRHGGGALICMTWHAVCPLDEEPVSFKGGIQQKIRDEDWREILQPGSRLHKRWQQQVDLIAAGLKQLQDAGVPVLWRPYHEMNGAWFWWGGRPGPQDFSRLWVNLYEYLTEHHGLHNLIWVWNPNGAYDGTPDFRPYYPGDAYVDVLAVDVYRQRFTEADYRHLNELAGGRPLALGEVGHMPKRKVLEKFPRYGWFLTWATFLTDVHSEREIRRQYRLARVMSLGELRQRRQKS